MFAFKHRSRHQPQQQQQQQQQHECSAYTCLVLIEHERSDHKLCRMTCARIDQSRHTGRRLFPAAVTLLAPLSDSNAMKWEGVPVVWRALDVAPTETAAWKDSVSREAAD